MFRARITTPAGKRYEITGESQAALAERIAAKATYAGATVVYEDMTAEIAQADADRTARAQAVAFLRGLDFDTATAAQTRTACKALWVLLKAIHQEGS